jgi:hypothetical protein
MRSLAELPINTLQVARNAALTLMRFKAYMPPGGLLLMLVSKFADDMGDVLGIERDPLPQRGRECRSLDELTSIELDTVTGATGILLDRFTDCMDDPALPGLLREFRDDLEGQKAERAQLRASIGS